ncbi:hypothetical protein V496_03814, partial [Pseudogymnoascus sp. VKM F-4515 (FW-2607)]
MKKRKSPTRGADRRPPLPRGRSPPPGSQAVVPRGTEVSVYSPPPPASPLQAPLLCSIRHRQTDGQTGQGKPGSRNAGY